MVRVVGVCPRTSAARFSLGIVRLVESAVKPSRRHTKTRGILGDPCGPWHYHRTRALDTQRQYLPVMMEVPRLSRRVVRGVNWGGVRKLVSTKTANGGGEGQPLAA